MNQSFLAGDDSTDQLRDTGPAKRDGEDIPATTVAAGKIRSLAVLIPVYNGEATVAEVVGTTIQTISPHFERIEVILVNDGSSDSSHQACVALVDAYPGLVQYVKLARNFGEHNAVLCGLNFVTADCVAIIDDDFQNPPSEILKLAKEMSDGDYDVVYSYYEKKQHSLFRNLGSQFHNWLATYLLKKPRSLYLSSFKVMNKFLVDEVTKYQGPYPYIDALILRSTSSIGRCLCFHQSRQSGRSSYNLARLIRLWLTMVTSQSILPLRIATVLGLAVSSISFLLFLFFIASWALGGVFFQRDIPPGWASIISLVALLGGIQLSLLGVLGEYVGRMFLTLSQHPPFVVRDIVGTLRSEPTASK